MSDERQAIGDQFAVIARACAEIARMMGGKVTAGASARTGGGRRDDLATDREMAHEKADFDIRKDPKDWTGDSMVGRRASECPSEFLVMVGDLKDWMADKDEASGDPEKQKKASWSRLDARRARTWAQRNAGGAKPQAVRATPVAFGSPRVDDDDVFGAGATDDGPIPFARIGDVG